MTTHNTASLPSPIPTALIGCGTVAQYGHLPAIADTPGLKLVAVADNRAETARDIAARYGAAPYTDYHELLAQPEIKAVTVSTPLALHHEVVAAALRAGKHVLCEKPFAATPQQGDELVALAKEKGCLVAVNFEYRLDEAVGMARQVLDSGELGTLQVMRFVNNWSAHGVQGQAGERRARFLQDGGGCLDCGVHFLDLARFFSQSEFGFFSALGHWEEPQYAGPGHMLISARMQSGAMVHLESSFIYTHRSRERRSVLQYELIGERGVVSWSALPASAENPTGEMGELQILTDQRSETLHLSSAKQFAATYERWADSLQRGTLEGSGLASGEDGNQATRWMSHALELAARERQQAV